MEENNKALKGCPFPGNHRVNFYCPDVEREQDQLPRKNGDATGPRPNL